ncbi:MAG: zinc-ribbon domain-containing protein [candidate division WOR-3 bacterium]
MKNCPNCGAENPDESRYCVKCGALLGGPGETPTSSVASGPYTGEVVGGPPPEKKSKWWIWLIIGIAAVLIIAIGICCILSGGCAMLGMMNQ